MAESRIITIHGLQDLIERAIGEEAELHRQATLKNAVSDQHFRHRFIADALDVVSRDLASHIAKTIIGESFELELVRKMRPMVREHGALMRLIGSVAKDFLTLEEDDEKMTVLQGLKIPLPKEGDAPSGT